MPQSVLDQLRSICSDVHLVQGDFDDIEAPDQLVGVLAPTAAEQLLALHGRWAPPSCPLPPSKHTFVAPAGSPLASRATAAWACIAECSCRRHLA